MGSFRGKLNVDSVPYNLQKAKSAGKMILTLVSGHAMYIWYVQAFIYTISFKRENHGNLDKKSVGPDCGFRLELSVAGIMVFKQNTRA